MISCFSSGAPEVTNNVVAGDLDQTHVEVHNEAIKASGITITVVLAILFFGCWYYHYRRVMHDSAVVHAHRAQRRHPFAFANPFGPSINAHPLMQMAPMAQAPPVVQLPPYAPSMYYKEPQ